MQLIGGDLVGYDVIGDIHGQAAKLTALLRKLGYSQRGDGWKPPADRMAIFLGDLIDRGPEQVETVNIVRRMVDNGGARCIMGNHEFNALGYATVRPGARGNFLRPHSIKNIDQHAEFLRQVVEGSPLHREFLEWFRTLPVTLDLGGIRVVHAWWHDPFVDLVRRQMPEGQPMDDEFLVNAHKMPVDDEAPSKEWQAMEGLT